KVANRVAPCATVSSRYSASSAACRECRRRRRSALLREARVSSRGPPMSSSFALEIAAMCGNGAGHVHGDDRYGFIVDTPEIRALIDETQRQMASVTDAADRVEALKPAFARLLAADGWLPDALAKPDEKSRMGDGIGQYALYRADDGSLCLFSLVV